MHLDKNMISQFQHIMSVKVCIFENFFSHRGGGMMDGAEDVLLLAIINTKLISVQ